MPAAVAAGIQLIFLMMRQKGPRAAQIRRRAVTCRAADVRPSRDASPSRVARRGFPVHEQQGHVVTAAELPHQITEGVRQLFQVEHAERGGIQMHAIGAEVDVEAAPAVVREGQGGAGGPVCFR
ncbi:hypothetical protein ACIBLA_20245 [Streptomyces sp. NPDC050433]|uniref:hypothetical protein n=1 Tax=Streptomyces sp. NPDC050433 TaxID=3365615 RepID=UPI003787C7EF